MATCPGPGVSSILPAYVHRFRGSRRRDPHCLRARRRAVRCDRAAPAVPWHHRKRQGARLCSDHRWVDASARAPGQGTTTAAWQGAVARSASGFGDCPGGLPTTALPRAACLRFCGPGRACGWGRKTGLGHSLAAPSADRRRQLPEAYRILTIGLRHQVTVDN